MRLCVLVILASGIVSCCSQGTDNDDAVALQATRDALAAAERGEYYYIRPSWVVMRPADDDGVLPVRVVSDAVPRPTFVYMKHFNEMMKRLAAIHRPREAEAPPG